MSDKKDEALKLALEALESDWDGCVNSPKGEAITAIREALAEESSGTEQPAQQQEPVAYASDVEFDDETEIIPAEQKGKLGTAGLRIPLYIDPPASKPWVGLTRAERFEIEKAMSKYYDYQHECKTVCLPEFARAIEAKLKEKNA